MRRASAILLLAVFCLLLTTPLLPRDTDALLPPCCRGNGKHHCAASLLANGLVTLSTPAFSAATEKCPFFPTAGCVPLHPQASLPVTLRVQAAGLNEPCSPKPLTEIHRPVLFSRTCQKRGPPSQQG